MFSPLKRLTPVAAGLAIVAATQSSSLLAADAARLQQVEQQLASLQQQLAGPQAERLQFNGFFSTGYSRATNDAGYAGNTETSALAENTLLGLQGRYNLSRDTSLTLQMVARGSDDWSTEMEWAYLSHRITPSLQVRAGKLRLPLFMHSDALEVGYAQTALRPNREVYGVVPVNSYTGADLTYDHFLPYGSVSLQLFSGHSEDTTAIGGNPVDIEMRNVVGGVITWTDFTWTLRLNAATADTSISGEAAQNAGFGDGSSRGNFYGLGVQYDDGLWQITSEMTRIEVDSAYSDTDSAYLTVAHRLGSWTPYISAGWLKSQDDSDRQGVNLGSAPNSIPAGTLNIERQSYSLGLRWDLLSNTALTADWTHVNELGDTLGGLSGNIDAGRQAFSNSNIYSLRLDSVF